MEAAIGSVVEAAMKDIVSNLVALVGIYGITGSAVMITMGIARLIERAKRKTNAP